VIWNENNKLTINSTKVSSSVLFVAIIMTHKLPKI